MVILNISIGRYYNTIFFIYEYDRNNSQNSVSKITLLLYYFSSKDRHDKSMNVDLEHVHMYTVNTSRSTIYLQYGESMVM